MIKNDNSKINDLVLELESNMFTLKNINYFCKHNQSQLNNIKEKSNTIEKNQNQNKNINNIYKIKDKDTLFWCFYILKYGFSNYEINVGFKTEKEEKYKYISIFRNKKDLLKLHKIKPLSDLEDELANKEYISVKTFIALCIIENINIFIVDNRKCFELIVNEDTKINIIYKEKELNNYYMEINDDDKNVKNKIQYYKDNYLLMNNYDNKLKSINSYKMDELHDLCKKLDINLINNKKLTKKDIYELLIINFR